MKRFPLCILFIALLPFQLIAAQSSHQEKISSPGGKLELKIFWDEQVRFSVYHRNRPVVENASVALHVVEKGVLGFKPSEPETAITEMDEDIEVTIPSRSAQLQNHYTELKLTFDEGYALNFRLYDYGVAYRFETSFNDSIFVHNEELNLQFAGNVVSYFPEEESMMSHYERLYNPLNIRSITGGSFASLPIYFQNSSGVKMLFTESDLFSYPGLFLAGTGSNTLSATFPRVVLETKLPEVSADRHEIITKEADYIAHTAGVRTFPWRILYISEDMGDILKHDLVYQLSRPLQIENTEWIKPGKAAWEWWNSHNLYDVDFKSGINTETYKYYIDFASEFGLEYLLIDEGWTKSTTNVTEANPDIDLQEIIEYGRQKGVDILLWVLWKPLEKNMEEILDLYREWGAKGIKVDFMQRTDQFMVEYYERVAREAAERQLVVNFHGAYKPSGLRRAYPNVLTKEGVKAMEANKWSREITPQHAVTLPFVRMVAGPMDFTPGAMDNAMGDEFFPRFDRPMSQGTRCHQLAMFIIYESPLQVLADSPSNYYREKESIEFISKIPTVWDETIFLDGEISDYIAIARKKGQQWFIGAMTDEHARELELELSFLEDGTYEMQIIKDGINANRIAIDYEIETLRVDSDSTLQIKMAEGGGWAAILTKTAL